jgi:chorismate synthase
VPASGVVAEAMVMLVIAEALTEKFGGDSLEELRRNRDSFVSSIPETIAPASPTVQ